MRYYYIWRLLIDFYKIDEKEISNNKKIRVFLVENRNDLYDEIARVMVKKLLENNKKKKITSFKLPVGPKGSYKNFSIFGVQEALTVRI